MAAKVFERCGYSYLHHRGSHMIYRKTGASKLSIPDHKTLDRGSLRKLISEAGLTVDEFVRVWREI